MCNVNSQGCNSCGGRWCYKRDECHHFQCPARSDISKAEMDLRNEKLCALQAKLKAKGYQINLQESSHYEHRGYATYESSIWPKPSTCLRPLYDESSSESKTWQAYKEDVTPVYLTKYFNDDYNLAFLPNQKVASTSFTKYLTCKYGAWDETIMEMDNSDRKIVMAVRDPVTRFISGKSTTLEMSSCHSSYKNAHVLYLSIPNQQQQRRFSSVLPITIALIMIVTKQTASMVIQLYICYLNKQVGTPF
jgi:hypothetical protein